MKITINQLRRIIREEVEAVTEVGFKDVYGDDVDSPEFKGKLAARKAVIIPPAGKPVQKVSAAKPVGVQRGEWNFDELVASLTPEQQAELKAALDK